MSCYCPFWGWHSWSGSGICSSISGSYTSKLVTNAFFQILTVTDQISVLLYAVSSLNNEKIISSSEIPFKLWNYQKPTSRRRPDHRLNFTRTSSRNWIHYWSIFAAQLQGLLLQVKRGIEWTESLHSGSYVDCLHSSNTRTGVGLAQIGWHSST